MKHMLRLSVAMASTIPLLSGCAATQIVDAYVSLFTLGLRPLAANQPSTNFRQFMSLSVTSIGVSLATFVGMLLGVRTISDVVKEGVQTVPVAPDAAAAVAPVQQLASGTLRRRQ